jgi:uncharacterized protein YjbI with pentapeptide repeats
MNTTTLKESVYFLISGFDNLNIRSNYIVQSLAEANTKVDWQRTISIAMPFFSLHSKAAPVVSHLARGYQLYAIWMEDSKSNYNKPLQTALLAGSIALDHIFPSAQLLYSSMVLFIDHAQKFQKGGNWDKAESLYQISSQIVHLASIYYGTPKWVVLSLLSQAVGELKKACKEERKPEAIANVVLAAIRGYKAGSYIYNDFSLARAKQVQPEPISPEEYDVSDNDYNFPESKFDFVDSNPPAELLPEIKSDEPDFSAYEFEDHDCSDDSEFPQSDTELSFPNSEAINPPAEKPAWKNLTTSDWKVIYQKYFAAPQQELPAKLHLGTLLKLEGFSNSLNDIDFTQTGSLKNIYFNDLKCTNCNFSGVKISNAEFKNFTAINCSFKAAQFGDTSFSYSTFKSCDFTNYKWIGSVTYCGNTIEDCGEWPHGKITTAAASETSQQPLKNLTQEDWKKFYQKHIASRSKDISEVLKLIYLLKDEGFSPILNDIDFSQIGPLEWVSFEEMQCNNCNFSNIEIYASSFDCLFTAVNCNFSNTTMNSVTMYHATFKSCNFSYVQILDELFLVKTTFENCIGDPSFCENIEITGAYVGDKVEAPDEYSQIEPAFKNPSSPFTAFDHELNGDLEAKIDAKHYTMVDANNNEYDFGSYFHGFGQSLVKGANLNFRKVVYKNGSKGLELSFRVNHIFHKRLRKIIGAMKEMSPEEQLEFAKEFQACGMKLKSKATYTLGQQRSFSNSAYKVTIDGVGSLMVGRKSYYSLKDQVKVTLKDGATLESFHHFLAIFGLQDALKKSSEEDLEKLKLGILFRTFFPMKAHYLEKNGDTFNLTLDQLKQKLIDEVPKMEKIMGKYAVQKIELFPGYFKYGVPLDKKAYSMGARALTTALTSLSDEMKEADLDQVANILKNGLLSQEMRERNGISSGGLNEEEEYEYGGSQSIYSQMITSTDLTKQKSMKDFGYSSPVRLFISLEALNQGSYQYYDDEFGVKDSDIYLTRPTIPEFIKRDLSKLEGHEIMSPDRVLPGYIKAMSVKTEEIKKQIIAHLRKCNLIHDEQINGIPVDEFIRTEHRITPDLVKHCSHPSSEVVG